MPKLTKKFVDAVEIKPAEYQISDSELPGFGMRVFPSGRKSFFLQYRAGNKTRRYAIGFATLMNVDDARQMATQILAAVRSGGDPVGDKLVKNMAPTVNDLADRYITEHCEVNVKPSTLSGYKQILKDYVRPALGHLKVTDVTKSHIASLQNDYSSQKAKANRIIEVVSKMFNLAELWGWRPDGTNPCRHIKKFKEVKRERYLTHDEMKRLGEALNMAEDANLLSVYGIALFRLLVLTGARLSEIQFCRWEWVDLGQAVIRLPDSKTGAKIIPLGRVAISVLENIPRKAKNPYVICSEIREGKPLNNAHSMWVQIRTWAELTNMRIHDLRHTFASSAVNIGTTLPIIGKILGHTQTQTTARYAHLAVSPAVEAANKVNDHMSALLALPAPRMDTVDGDEQAEEPVLKKDVPLPVFYSSDQAAAYLNVKPRLMENWRWRKCGPDFVKIGNRIRYRQEALDSFIRMEA